ncbi:hypothetical protein STSP2_01391 [Anaerohalosphaera lusitana]|uniref:Uncharacterized protein n=1 Tax=Anaerohalosphaera lusitana TaxID=1936003 RepID=A0A1U9NK88_9BACT|nr:hypothetical protein [Anaerohalosphaera lusitana]AQT68235.1 hypothetical protein STSP2_01391 [Anaerohalosphaera lusitana]
MQPLFTVHAGEYLVGSYIEKHFKKYNVWVPSKDTGIDLLVTDSKNRMTATIQVKYSKDYTTTHMKPGHNNGFRSWGWWTLNPSKIRSSKADLWVFVMQSFAHKSIECVVIPPKELMSVLKKVHGHGKKKYQSYMWVRNDDTCWETRGLIRAEKYSLAHVDHEDENRNLTDYLNNWKPLKQKLARSS